MTPDYSREKTLQIVKGLINGSVDPMSASAWADKIESPNNSTLSLEIQQNDPRLYQLISDISLAGAKDDQGEFVYDEKDFQSWLDEFLQVFAKVNIETSIKT